MDKRAGRAPKWPYNNLVMVWMCGLGALTGAFGGAFVGYLYGLDQALTAAAVPWYAATGLLIGAAAGSLLSLAPAGVLVALQHRSWATAPVRIALTALVGAAPLTLYQLLVSGFAITGEVIVFCAVVTGAPAGLAAAGLALSTRRSLPR